MTDDSSTAAQPTAPAPRWQPIGAIDRRVIGVLAEKAKTTPSGYPMSLNSICTGCNQKSNRAPLMNLQLEDVEESLERLRLLGAAAMIEGHGRVTKYRHYLYEWLGVDKVELSVITELLLRGAQTEGELRARASRMDPIPDLGVLRPVLASLKEKGLIVPLTPEGRGHVLTHALYTPRELENLRAQYSQSGPTGGPVVEDGADFGASPGPPRPQSSAPHAAAAPVDPDIVDSLRREIDTLRSQVNALEQDLEEVSSRQQQSDEEIRRLRDALGV